MNALRIEERVTELGDGRVIKTWWSEAGSYWCETTSRAARVLSASGGHASRQAAIAWGTSHTR